MAYLSFFIITFNRIPHTEVINLNRDDRLIEKAILSRVDRLVNILIELSHTNEHHKGTLLEEAVKVIEEMKPLLLGLVDGQEQHLEPMLRQLISQKLPNGVIMNSFGDLQKDLTRILNLALRHETSEQQNIVDKVEQLHQQQYNQSKTGHPVKKENPKELLEQFLKKTYPDMKIVKGYYIRSLCLDFYLPEKKLGFILVSPQYRNNKVLEHFLKKEEIKLIEVYPADLENSRLLARKMPK